MVEGHEGAGQGGEGEVDVGATLIADGQTAEAGEPRQRTLDDPAVAAQALTAFDAPARDTRLDSASPAFPAATAVIVGFVGVQLAGPVAWASRATRAHRRDRVERRDELGAVVSVGPGQDNTERRAAGIDDEVALRARLAPVGRVRAGRRPPFFAGRLALSSAARLQSSCPAPSSRSSKARCRLAHTPALCQSRSRRQHDMPEPQPISCGKYSHGKPVRSTNRMPVSAARSGIGGRPPFGRARPGGSSGAITAQRSSGTRNFAMLYQRANRRFR